MAQIRSCSPLLKGMAIGWPCLVWDVIITDVVLTFQMYQQSVI